MSKQDLFSIRMNPQDKARWLNAAKEQGYTRTLKESGEVVGNLSALIKDLLREFERNPELLNPTAISSQNGMVMIDPAELQRINEKLNRLDQNYTSLFRKGKSFLKSDLEAIFE